MKKLTFPKDDVIKVLRTLEECVVSLDRIGSATYDWSPADRGVELESFLRKHRILRKMAEARSILGMPLRGRVGRDGMDELERRMQRVRYWKPVGKKSRRK